MAEAVRDRAIRLLLRLGNVDAAKQADIGTRPSVFLESAVEFSKRFVHVAVRGEAAVVGAGQQIGPLGRDLAHPLQALPGDPERWIWLLVRARQCGRGLKRPVLPLVGEVFASPGLEQDVQRLVEHRPALVPVDPEPIELVLGRATRHPDVQAPLGHPVNERDLLCEVERMVVREYEHPRQDPESLRHGAYARGEDQVRGIGDVVGEVVLGQHDGFVAEVVRPDRHLEAFVQQLPIRSIDVRIEVRKRYAELQGHGFGCPLRCPCSALGLHGSLTGAAARAVPTLGETSRRCLREN